jgi:hypothetical protein
MYSRRLVICLKMEAVYFFEKVLISIKLHAIPAKTLLVTGTGYVITEGKQIGN